VDRIFIPLMPGTKRPIREATRWQAEDADPAAWEAHAKVNGNWGLRLDGLLVIDCDTAEAHEWWLSHGYPSNWVCKTPHGWHHYYDLGEHEVPGAGPLRGPNGEQKWIDVKTGRKHYVVIPPSKLEDGGVYEWITGGDAR